MAVVNAPLVVAFDAEGKQHYLWAGTEVPSNIPDSELDRLADYLDGYTPKKKQSDK